MYKTEAIRFFGTKTKLAKAAGVKIQSIYKWGDLVPERRALRLELASAGKLKYHPELYGAELSKKLNGDLIHENQHGREQGTDRPGN